MCVHFQKAQLLLQDTRIGPPNHLTNPLRQGIRVDSSSGMRNRDQQPRAGRPTIPSPVKIFTDRLNWTKKVVYLVLPTKSRRPGIVNSSKECWPGH
ncbi:hypothetical protein E2C01_035483 [Portunus trituberculatus]|uniref:Uncharacterized protein n=1 Tax=Portunus trituberculatus TaxID=210409 RepID=A0A5B7F9A4_PORTR|nr:hypothetical protein [Portunus trituberculatus]